jgi:hypothetical protein
MKGKWLALIGVVLVLLASGCAAASPQRDLAQPREVIVEKVVEAPAAEEGRYFAADVDETLQTASQEHMIIYTVEMSLIVKDTSTALEQIESLASEMGGFVSDSSSWKEEGQLRARVSLRVPAAGLDESLGQIRDLALDIESESRSSQDVTEDFADLDAQLRNRQAYEQELLELLTARREATGKTEDLLEVYRELTRVRGEIEQIQGRMNYLANLSALATVNLNLTPDILAQPVVVGQWRPQGTALKAIQALINALKFLVDALIWIVLYILPVLAIILLPLFLIVRAAVKRRRARRRPTTD